MLLIARSSPPSRRAGGGRTVNCNVVLESCSQDEEFKRRATIGKIGPRRHLSRDRTLRLLHMSGEPGKWWHKAQDLSTGQCLA